jgi:uncharacterized membrane protein YebE (DUF533 family)
MTSPTISDYATESIAWKTIGGGTLAHVGAYVAGINWGAVITLAVVVFGGYLHYKSYQIKKREEKARIEEAQVLQRLAFESAEREKEKQALEIALLKKKLEGKDSP